MTRTWPIVLLAITTQACVSFSTHLTPRPTNPGVLEIDAHVDALTYYEDNGTLQGVPNVEAQVRYGLARILDVGAKASLSSIEVNARVALLVSDRLDLSLVPAAGFSGVEATSGHDQALIATFGLPFLAGIHVGHGTTLLIGAKLHAHLGQKYVKTVIGSETRRSYEGSELVLYPGAVAGFELTLSDHFALFPELNVLFPYLVPYDKFARPVYQGGIAFQFRFSS